MTDEQMRNLNSNLDKLAEHIESTIHEFNVTIATLLTILELRGVFTRDEFFAARAAASPVADQIVEEISRKQQEK